MAQEPLHTAAACGRLQNGSSSSTILLKTGKIEKIFMQVKKMGFKPSHKGSATWKLLTHKSHTAKTRRLPPRLPAAALFSGGLWVSLPSPAFLIFQNVIHDEPLLL